MRINLNSIDKGRKGVYKIISKDKKYIYIGSSCGKTGFGGRYNTYQWRLKHNKCHNKKIQNIYNKHGHDYLIFECIEFIDNKTNAEIHNREEELIEQYMNEQQFILLNFTTDARGGAGWRQFKTKDELKKIDAKKRLAPSKQILRNIRHSKTLKAKPPFQKQQKIEKHIETFYKNREKHKNYKPFKIVFNIPNEYDTYTESYTSESDFFNKTKFEESILRKLKNKKTHTVKRVLKNTKHTYPTGTVLEYYSNSTFNCEKPNSNVVSISSADL